MVAGVMVVTVTTASRPLLRGASAATASVSSSATVEAIRAAPSRERSVTEMSMIVVSGRASARTRRASDSGVVRSCSSLITGPSTSREVATSAYDSTRPSR